MSYVDAGYAICLGALGLYAFGLVLRRRRLERAAAMLDAPESDRIPSGPTGGRARASNAPASSPPAVDGGR